MTLDEEITKLDLIASDAFEGGDANEFKQLVELLRELRAYRKAKEKIEKMDTNYYKHCNGLDMTECAEDFKFEVLRIINECVESELINDEDD